MSREIRVLHVDDDPQFSALTVEFLASIDERLDIRTESDPVAALEMVTPDDVDCLVSDYDMPAMNGIEFLEAVRAEYPDLPFILFTGKGSEEVASDAISAGVTDYLQKHPGSDQFHLLANRVNNAVEQKWATEAAEETERRLRELAENTTDVVWMFSGDWEELLFINSVVSDVFGVDPGDLYRDAERFLEHIHPTHREQVERAMDRVSEGYPIELEYRVAPGGGNAQWVWVSGEPILNDEGEVDRVVGFSRDISDRKRRERERHEATRRLDVVIDNVEACIWMRDGHRRFLLANNQFQTTFGIDPTVDVVGCLPSDLFDEETAALLAELDDEVLATETTLERECTLPRADGRGTYLVRITPLFDEHDTIAATCGIATDISERKRREERLQAQSERLAAVTGVIAGDLQPSLTAIDAVSSSGQADTILNSLSSISRGRPLSVETVTLDGLVESVWEDLGTEDWELEFERTVHITADPGLLEQMIRNLVRGVLSEPEEGRLTIGAGRDEFFLDSDAIDPPPFADRKTVATLIDGEGWEPHLAVARWVAQRHEWSPSIETGENGHCHIAFGNVDLIRREK